MSLAADKPLSPDRFEEILWRSAPLYRIVPAPAALAALSRYLAELDRWRRRINLTGALSGEELAGHALESLLGATLIAHGERVVDIGSGGGFPGLPIALARRDLAMTLVEPRGKRAAFLRHVVRELDVGNAQIFEGRIEEVGGQTFGVATTRALGSFSRWIGSARFLVPGGALLSWTTEPEGQRLSPLSTLRLERTLAVPGTRRRVIALYRRREQEL